MCRAGGKLVSVDCCRDKERVKEREDAWIKLTNLAKSNPQVSDNKPVLGGSCRDDQGPQGRRVSRDPCSQQVQHASVMFA